MPISKLFRRGMSCNDILEVLQSYLDGEVEADTARQVATHLAKCDRCDRESEIFNRIKGSLNQHRIDIDPEVRDALASFGERLARGEVD